jgi:hypothetical protein
LAQQIFEGAMEMWASNCTIVELVGARYLPRGESQLRSVVRKHDGQIHILVAAGLLNEQGRLDIDVHRDASIVAEAIISATCEHHLGMSHDHSILAELLVADRNNDGEIAISEGVKHQLRVSAKDRAHVIAGGDKMILRHLLLGVNPETMWDDLPQNIRTFLLAHSAGQSHVLSIEEEDWIAARSCAADAFSCEDYIARYHLSATLTTAIVAYARRAGPARINFTIDSNSLNLDEECIATNSNLVFTRAAKGPLGYLTTRVKRVWMACVKFLILSLVADPEYQRELDYMTSTLPSSIRYPITFPLNGIWCYAKFLQSLIIPVVIFHERDNVKALRSNMKGIKTVLQKNSVLIENLRGPSTCFWSQKEDGNIKLRQYSRKHDTEPEGMEQLIAINNYGDKFRLRQREEYKGEKLLNMFSYEYPQGKKPSKLPLQRQCIQGRLSGEIVRYDWRG